MMIAAAAIVTNARSFAEGPLLQDTLTENNSRGLIMIDLNLSIKGGMIDYFFSQESKPDESEIIRQESALESMLKRFSVSLNNRVTYFKLSEKEAVALRGRLFGGFCDAQNETLASIYWFDPHESSHLVGGKMGKPPLFISEGFAVYNSWLFAPEKLFLYEERKRALQSPDNNLMNKLLSDDAFKANPESITYPLAGLFMEYVAKQKGTEYIKELFSEQKDKLPAMIRKDSMIESFVDSIAGPADETSL
jgi:hypothetical protein